MNLSTQALILLPKVACLDFLLRTKDKGLVIVPLLDKWNNVIRDMINKFREKGWRIIEVKCPNLDEIECMSLAYAIARKLVNQGYIPTFCTDRTDWILGATLLISPALHTHIHKLKSLIVNNLSELSELSTVLKYDIELLYTMACSPIPKLPLNILDQVLELLIDHELKDNEISNKLSIDISQVHMIRRAIFESSRCRAFRTGWNGVLY